MRGWLPTVVGVVAGCCSTPAFVPQVLKIWREGDTRAISTRMYVLRDVGFVLWLAYGLALGSAPLVVFNVVSLLLGGTILVLKLRGKAREARGRPRPTAARIGGRNGNGGGLRSWVRRRACARPAASCRRWSRRGARATRGALSLRMYLVLTAGFVLWLGYGLLIGSWPVIASTSPTWP